MHSLRDYQADAIMDSEARVLVKTWKQHILGKRTVVFSANIKLSNTLENANARLSLCFIRLMLKRVATVS
jgi:hypothetical protein